MDVEESKPPSGNINSLRQYLHDIGTLRVLCSGVGKDRFRTRVAWGLYCFRKSGVKDILETN